MPSPLVMALSQQNQGSPTQSGIAPADVLGAYNLASNVAQKNYEAKLAQQNAKFGGMAQLGSAGLAAGGALAAPKLSPYIFGNAPNTITLAEGAPGAIASGTTAAAPTVAADIGAASAPVDAAGGLYSGIFAPSATLGSAGAGTVASDLAAAAPVAAGAGEALGAGGAAAGAGGIADALASAGLPEWLASFLPFLAAA